MNALIQIGEELKRRRIELGVSFEEAYLRTRIAPAYIRAIEAGDLSALPGPCYTAGFVRSYCQFLEIEAERYVDCFLAAMKPSGRFRSRGRSYSVLAETLFEPRAFLPEWAAPAATWAVICGIVALSWVAYSVIFQPSADPVEGRAQAGTFDAEDMIVPPTLDDTGY